MGNLKKYMDRMKNRAAERDPADVFLDVLIEYGLEVSSLIPDGKIHRVKAPGDKGTKKSGYYKFYADGVAAGLYGNWKEGEPVSWSSRKRSEMTAAEVLELKTRIEETRQQREKDLAEQYKKAADQARKKWDAAKEAGDHPYLTEKGVEAFGIRRSGDNLLIPLLDTSGAVKSLQTIKPGGEKRYLSGGQIRGNFFAIKGEGEDFFICEGYATGATIHEATGATVFIAFDAVNLAPVAEVVRAALGATASIVVAADNDHETARRRPDLGNPGVKAATEAANAIAATVIVPEIQEGTDYNDLAAAFGIDAVREQIRAGLGEILKEIDHAVGVSFIEKTMDLRPPERSWILDDYIPTGSVGLLAGAGGTGKSNLSLLMARSIATGKEIGPFKPDRPRRVVVVNVEDSEDDIWRRLAAQYDRYSLDVKDRDLMRANLTVYPGRGEVGPLMLMDNGNPAPSFYAGWLERSIDRLRPDLVILDTTSRLYGLEENRNDHAAVWLALLEKLAGRYGASFLFLHHMAKARAEKGGQFAVRGASALVDNARFGITLAPMSDKQGARFGVSNHFRYFQMLNAKANYAEPISPIWFEKHQEGVPVEIDIAASRFEAVCQYVATWISDERQYITLAEINRGGGRVSGLLKILREDFKVKRADVVQAINWGIEKGLLVVKEIRSEKNKVRPEIWPGGAE